jgi:3-oxoadipate enol-lactonase
MDARTKLLLKLAVFVAILVIVVPMVVGGWLMWKKPLKVDAWMSRLALNRNGLEAQQIETSSGEMTVWVGGSGPPMVLLHGAGDQAGAWARAIGPLVAEYRVIVPDLPGHWRSDPTSGPFGIEEVLDGLTAVMDELCANDPAILVGNSMGAWVSFLYAVDHPNRIGRLVAVNGGPLAVDDPGVNLFPQNRDEARETMKGLMGPNTLLPPNFVLDDIVRNMNSGPAARLAQRLVASGDQVESVLLTNRLDQVQVPVDLVWGDADELMTVAYAQEVLDGLPAARMAIIKDCGHVPHRECPDRFLKVLNEALALPPPAPAPEPEPEPAEETS